MKVILTWPPNLGLQGLWSRLRMGDGRRAVIGFIREHTPGYAKANCRPNCSAGKATSGGGRSEVMVKIKSKAFGIAVALSNKQSLPHRYRRPP